MAVVDLEESELGKREQVFGGLTPNEVRMIEHTEHRLTGALALRLNRGEIPAEDLDRAGTSLLRNRLADVDAVHVRALAPDVLGDLFPRDEEEAAGVVERCAIFVEAPQADLERVARPAILHPLVAKACDVSAMAIGAGTARRDRHPTLGGRWVVVGHRQKLIARGLVPIDDHLGVVIPVAPQ